MSVAAHRTLAGPPPDLPADWPHRTASRRVDAGGIDWHVQLHRSRNPDAALTLVLLHGTGASAHSWAELIEPLGELATLVNLDLPGHGWTRGAAPGSLRLAAVADALQALLLRLDLDGDIGLVGHSAGAAVALEWALRHAAHDAGRLRARAIVGLNPSLVPPPAVYTTLLGPAIAPLATSRPLAVLLARGAANSSLIDRLLASTGSRAPAWSRACYRRLFSRPEHVRGSMGFMAGADLPGLLARGGDITVPVAFVLGRQDPWVRLGPLRRVIRAHFPFAQCVEVDGGHLLHEERPLETAALVAQGLRTALQAKDPEPPVTG